MDFPKVSFLLLSLLLLHFSFHNVSGFQNPHVSAAATRVETSKRRTKNEFLATIPTSRLSLTSRGDTGNKNKDDEDELFLLEYSIDSFLRGDYDRSFSEDAASPLPGLSPSDTVDAALRSLRDLDDPEPFHGAAVFLRFCVALGRGDRWGTNEVSSWKEVLRSSLTPTMLARHIKASDEFSGFLEWSNLEIIENDGVAFGDDDDDDDDDFKAINDLSSFRNSNTAIVDARLSYESDTSPPEVYRFELAKMLGGVWLIDSVERTTP